MDYQKQLREYIDTALKEGGSDIHLSTDSVPTIRVDGSLIALVKKDPLSADAVNAFIEILLTEKERETLHAEHEVDFGYTYENAGTARFRGNAYTHRNGIGIALRLIPQKIKTLEELNLPVELERFANLKQGFFLAVGPVGSGKTTTIASLIDLINRERAEHIFSIERPIEYLFTPNQSLIHQREVPTDTDSFEDGLQSVFREDVNVLFIGEMRNAETISSAVTAAETGHLVFSTLHTNDAAQTIDRIIDSFPSNQQDQIRAQLAGSLAGIVSQRLIPRISGGRIPAYELLFNTTAVSNLIREQRVHEIDTVIGTSAEQGMISLNQSMADLIRRGEITTEDARAYSTNVRELEKMI